MVVTWWIVAFFRGVYIYIYMETSTVKPVYKDHSRDKKSAVFTDR